MVKKAAKNTMILSLGTFTSRILGFARDILIAKYFGTSAMLEAFIVSFRIPNILRSLFGEGLSDAVVTPSLCVYREDREKIFTISNDLILLLTFVLIVISLLGIVLSRYLIIIIAPGFIHDADKFTLAVSFTRITFLYFFFIALTANLKSVFYALKRFIVPAFSPCLLNISFIIGIIFFRGVFNHFVLVACVIVGGVLEFLFSYIFIIRQGFKLRFNLRSALKDKAIFKMFKLFIPRIWSAGIYQVSVLVDTIFASLSSIAGIGSLAAIYYANRLIQFPLALIALSVSRVAMVDLARDYAAGKFKDFRELFILSFRNIMLFVIPVSIIFILCSQNIIRVIFFRGAFNYNSLVITSSVLFFYSIGLLFFCEIKLMVSTFYSLGDTRTPAKMAMFSLLINVAASAILMFPLGAGGIALGSSIAAIFNFFLLWQELIKKIGYINCRIIYRESIKLIIIGLILGKEVLGCMLAGSTMSGVMMALMLSNAGGAWDNAKKFSEIGTLGRNGSDAH